MDNLMERDSRFSPLPTELQTGDVALDSDLFEFYQACKLAAAAGLYEPDPEKAQAEDFAYLYTLRSDKGRKLTGQERLFIAHYLTELNGPDAAVAAGYPRTASSRLLNKPLVQEGIRMAMEARMTALGLTQTMILREFQAIATSEFTDIVDINDDHTITVKKLEDIPPLARKSIQEITQVTTAGGLTTLRVKLYDKGAALMALAKHLGMLTDRLQITGSDDVVEELKAGRKRAENMRPVKGERVYDMEKT